MRYHLLACDYDGTIARDGAVDDSTAEALRKVGASGRKLVLVTGRELVDLLRVFPTIDLFDWVVAENGGVLYEPSTRQETPLAPEPSPELVALLRQRGVLPLSVGRAIIATWEPHETTVVTAIRELGLELQVIFNKGAVMVLPASVNKRSGLELLLAKIGVSSHNCVGIGDAENDHAFLSICEFSAAVGNALPALKQSVDWVAESHHGRGVCELVEMLLGDDLRSFTPQRLQMSLGVLEDGADCSIACIGPVGLVVGSSGSGKTTLARTLLEQLVNRDYQVCIVDPEGDYDALASAIVVGSVDHPPEIEQVLRVLAQPKTHVVANLLGVPFADRPHFFMELIGNLQHMRATTGRPHWIAIDEAHHVLDAAFEPMQLAMPAGLDSLLLITVNPQRLHTSLLQRLEFAFCVGDQCENTLTSLSDAIGIASPEVPGIPSEDGQVLYWERRSNRVQRMTLTVDVATQRRHRRKYARGELGPDKSFFFRGVDGKLNLRAQNLVVFNDLSSGVDDDTWLYHLRSGDYSGWIRDAIKDDELASRVAEVERLTELSAQESRARVRALIEGVYTMPA